MKAPWMGACVQALVVIGGLALASCGHSETWAQVDARHDNDTQQAMPPGCTASRFTIRGGTSRWLVRCPEGIAIVH